MLCLSLPLLDLLQDESIGRLLRLQPCFHHLVGHVVPGPPAAVQPPVSLENSGSSLPPETPQSAQATEAESDQRAPGARLQRTQPGDQLHEVEESEPQLYERGGSVLCSPLSAGAQLREEGSDGGLLGVEGDVERGESLVRAVDSGAVREQEAG